MTRIGTMLAVAAPLAFGMLLAEAAQAQLGTGGTALGAGGEAIEAAGEAIGAGSEQASPKTAAPRAFDNCITNRTVFRTQSNGVFNNSTTFAVMENTHFPVTHKAGCLIVDFSGEVTAAEADNTVILRAWIAGIGDAQPGDVVLGRPASTGISETRSMRFVFPGRATRRPESAGSEGGPPCAHWQSSASHSSPPPPRSCSSARSWWG